MTVSRQDFPNAAAWAKAVAIRIAAHLRDALTHAPETVLAAPGGRTARAVLPELAAIDLPWERIIVTITDERWVDETHPDSNETLIRVALAPLVGRIRVLGLKTPAPSPAAALPEVATRIHRLPKPFGCILLGMGKDGHIASLFPGETIGEGPCQAVNRPDHPRMTLTPTELLNSRAIVLAIEGRAKRAILDRALTPGPAAKVPVRHVLHQDKTDVEILAC